MDSEVDREIAIAKAAYLIKCFYNKKERVGMNLSGNSSKNHPRKAADVDIRDSIISMVNITIFEILFLLKLGDEIFMIF